MVMYAGRIVERGAKREHLHAPRHPYTWGLLDSIPPLDGPRPHRLKSIPGMPPSLLALPQGCAFGPRCRYRFEKCGEQPALGGQRRPRRRLLPVAGGARRLGGRLLDNKAVS